MAFEPVKLVHPKTGIVVIATTAVDLTTFRFNDGYVPVEQARTLVDVEGADKKYPKLAEGLKAVDEAEKAEKADEPESTSTEPESDKESAPKSTPANRGSKPAAGKSGTDASGNQVGVN